MSPGNEIRIWHSLALKCKRGVLALLWQFIIKASEFLLNIHEVQWIITGLAIITNFSKCTDKRVKYIIFPYVTRMDDLNGFLKLGGISYFLWIRSTLCPISHKATLFTLCSLFFWWRENGREREQRGREKKCHLLVSECFFFHSSNSSLPASMSLLSFSSPDWTKMRPYKSTDSASLQVTLIATRKNLHWTDETTRKTPVINRLIL